MLNPYYSFFVGKAFTSSDTSIDGLALGTVALAYENNGALALPATGTSGLGGKDFYVLQVVDKKNGKSIYRLSPRINEKMILNVNALARKSAPVQYTPQSFSINFTSIDITEGNTLMLTFHFYNVRDLSPQVFYMPFYTVMRSGDTAAAIAGRFLEQLNRDQYEKVTATLSGSTLTVTAVTPDYVITQRDEFCPLYFDVAVGELEKDANLISGTIPVTTKAVVTQLSPTNLGIGDWRVVSDQEKRAQARMGIMNWTAFPVTLPRMYTLENAIYFKYDITFATPYRAADDTINRLTNESMVIYTEGTGQFAVNSASKDLKKEGVGAVSDGSIFGTCLKLFLPNSTAGI